MSRAPCVFDTPQRNWNNIPDLRAMPAKVSVKDGKICNQTTSLQLNDSAVVQLNGP